MKTEIRRKESDREEKDRVIKTKKKSKMKKRQTVGKGRADRQTDRR